MSKTNKYAQVGKRVSVKRRNGTRIVGKVINIYSGRRGEYAEVEYDKGEKTIAVRPSQLEGPRAV